VCVRVCVCERERERERLVDTQEVKARGEEERWRGSREEGRIRV
jgi:hypothetical protein